MTALAQSALEFARECLGWKDADTFTIGRMQRVVRNLSATSGAGEIFNATDLNAVMGAAKVWCGRNQLAFTVCCDESGFEVVVFSPSLEEIDEEAISSNFCHALLAACVEAARKLKEVA